MELKNIFKEPVTRAIEGVIKADDEASLRLEIEEYVLTDEIKKTLHGFLLKRFYCFLSCFSRRASLRLRIVSASS